MGSVGRVGFAVLRVVLEMGAQRLVQSRSEGDSKGIRYRNEEFFGYRNKLALFPDFFLSE